MKTFKYIIILLAVMLTGGQTFAQKISKAELQVNGLTCSMCSKATETSLRSLSFIESIKPDLDRNIFVLTFKKDQQVNVDQIRDKVQDAGFSIGELNATFNFNQTVIDEAGLAQSGHTVLKFTNAKNKTLNGAVTAKILDKDFISSSAFKKNAAQLKMDTYSSGRGTVNGKTTRIVHLSI